ncbi:hypothetical protein Sru01_01980 [Sphaerisporangium rufum]|uniref:IrrE N-terminal-like domain-containing protein n=1 Tax=Sphaerisporangium rufum TaxID=1381558 RepID=A0A919QW38_9ACTN|nr:ImmA/IrrE family metallo-endopeptidase [Sphaerisporangium rufum]GII75216.1 hypothetical protein Sru01_01980 [Sphaerisporangium rufum]
MTTTPELRIRWEWEAPPPVRLPEHRVTWARIEIAVGGDHITLVEDIPSGSSRRSVYCPLYPIAEWLAYNWWFLRADARPARTLGVRSGIWHDPQMLRRHCVRASGDGFLWPELLIIPEGGQTHLLWREDRHVPATRPIRFLSRGEAFVDGPSITEELGHLISAVLTRLAEKGISDTPLEKEWAAIQQAEPEEVEFCLAAARLGLDPYAEAGPYEDLIIAAAGEMPPAMFGDFLDAVDPVRMAEALEWIQRARTEIGTARNAPAALDLRPAMGVPRPSPGHRPWEKGWAQARMVRRAAGVPDEDVFPLDAYVAAVERPAVDRGLQAVGGAAEERGPSVVVASGRAAGSRRFTLSRALWHHVWEPEPLFLVTTAATDRQQVERAFAAELLAPAAGIREIAGTPVETMTQEDLGTLAEHFQVSEKVIEHQVENQLLG